MNVSKNFRFICIVLAVVAMAAMVSAAPTTGLRVVRLAPDSVTIINETTVDYRWLEANLPVLGDGVTHYYHQGPVFVADKEGQWDPDETTNFKDRGAVKGTDVKDIVGLVGGMEPGDEVMIHATDGYHVEFRYPNSYTPEPRQGPIGICWYNGEETDVGERQGVGYPPDYYVGMRLVFFADTSTNAEGKHVFGNNDMRMVMPAEDIHLFDNLYPSTNGYTVKWVDEVRVYEGGYSGEKDSPVKSLADKTSDDTGGEQGGPMAAGTPAILTIITCTGAIGLLSRVLRGRAR